MLAFGLIDGGDKERNRGVAIDSYDALALRLLGCWIDADILLSFAQISFSTKLSLSRSAPIRRC